MQAIARLIVAPLARLLYRPVVEGRDNIPRRGAVILAANHLSFIDSIVIPLVAPRPVAFLAKAEYFQRAGFTGWLTRTCLVATGAVPVHRGGHRAARDALEVALGVLADGQAFGIHPEGSRSRDGRLYRGRTGVAWLALASGAPVVPVAVLGTDRIQPVGARFPRIGRITVRFGPPMHFADHQPARQSDPGREPEPGREFEAGRDARLGRSASGGAGRARRAITDEVMRAIRDLSGQEPADGYNPLSTAA